MREWDPFGGISFGAEALTQAALNEADAFVEKFEETVKQSTADMIDFETAAAFERGAINDKDFLDLAMADAF